MQLYDTCTLSFFEIISFMAFSTLGGNFFFSPAIRPTSCYSLPNETKFPKIEGRITSDTSPGSFGSVSDSPNAPEK